MTAEMRSRCFDEYKVSTRANGYVRNVRMGRPFRSVIVGYLPLMKQLALLLICAPTFLAAQDYVQPQQRPESNDMAWNLGLGLGIDYGGFGAQLQCRPAPPLVIFAGGGYALSGFGYNAGVQGRILPSAKWCPFISAMYGYNAVIVVQGASEFNQLYYGPSVGVGLEDHRRDNADNFWRFELILPFRPQEFQDDMDALKKNPVIDIKSEPPPFSFSVAFHFGL